MKEVCRGDLVRYALATVDRVAAAKALKRGSMVFDGCSR